MNDSSRAAESPPISLTEPKKWAAVVAIGDELTSGERVDTNSAWLSQKLAELGIAVRCHLTAADERQACAEAFRFAASHADFVISTGGLGPTADDLTREVLADVSGQPLQLDEAILAQIRARFVRRGRSFPERNSVQAMFPAGSRIIPNPHGTAPGIDVTVECGSHSSRVFALPGVPIEMREMWSQTVADAIRQSAPAGQAILHKEIKCFGVGESQLESMIPELIQRGREPRVGITVHRATITLRITAAGVHRAACLEAMQPTIAIIRERLGSLVFGEDQQELQDVVAARLCASRQTVAVCELGTSGRLAQWLKQAASALSPALSPDDWTALQGAVIVGDSTRVGDILPGVCELPTMSQEFTAAAAADVRLRFGADYGLAISDFLSDSGESPNYFISLVNPQGECVTEQCVFAGHPEIWVDRAAKQGLDLLRRFLS